LIKALPVSFRRDALASSGDDNVKLYAGYANASDMPPQEKSQPGFQTSKGLRHNDWDLCLPMPPTVSPLDHLAGLGHGW